MLEISCHHSFYLLQIRLDAKTQVLPGDTDDLTIFGQPGTVVGLSAVDKAVLLLNNKNVLHKNKVGTFQRNEIGKFVDFNVMSMHSSKNP